MALIQCVDCGAQVSDRAPSCARCGAPAMPDEPSAPPSMPPWRRRLQYVLGAGLVVIFALGIFLPSKKALEVAESVGGESTRSRSDEKSNVEIRSKWESEFAAAKAARAGFRVDDAVKAWVGTGCVTKEALIGLRMTGLLHPERLSPQESQARKRSIGCDSLPEGYRGAITEIDRSSVVSPPGGDTSFDLFPVRVREDGSGRMLWTWAVVLDPVLGQTAGGDPGAVAVPAGEGDGKARGARAIALAEPAVRRAAAAAGESLEQFAKHHHTTPQGLVRVVASLISAGGTTDEALQVAAQLAAAMNDPRKMRLMECMGAGYEVAPAGWRPPTEAECAALIHGE